MSSQSPPVSPQPRIGEPPETIDLRGPRLASGGPGEPLPSLGHGYDLVREQGRGGMGVVYQARDRRLGRFVCLKTLPFEAVTSQARMSRFEREARAISALNHPNICTLYELGERDGQLFLVLEWIDGQTLGRFAAQSELADLLSVSSQVARALAVAHEAGIVHRDVKPDNVMVRPDGIAKVLDFGIARLVRPDEDPDVVPGTEEGALIGTIRYMSPEQARGEPVGPASDVFSLGVVLYELTTSHHPFEAQSSAKTLAAIELEEPPPPRSLRPELPAALDALLLRMLAKSPDARPSAAEVADALLSLRAMVGPDLPPPVRPPTERPAPASHRRRRLLATLGLASLALAGIGWAFMAASGDSRELRARVPSVAVLPFTHSGDGLGVYFGEGVSEDIIAMLARAPEIEVASRGSSFAFQGRQVDAREVGRALGVDFVLEGSVRPEGDKVRIIAQLIDARTGLDVWSERYDETSSDPWALQDEVTGLIVGALTGELGQIKRAQYRESWGRDSTELAEYDFYLRGHERYMRLTPADNEEAMRIWQEGLTLIPGSALLEVKLGFAHYMRVYLFMDGVAEVDYRLASELARRALGRPDLSPLERRLAHWLQAYVSAQEGEHHRALREVETTMRLAPYDVFQRGDLSSILILAGELERALEWLDGALARDPANAPFYRQLRGWALCVAGRYEESNAELQSSIDLVAVPMLRAINFSRLGRPDSARAEVAKALNMVPGLTRERWRAANPFRDPEVIERQLEDLARAGLP